MERHDHQFDDRITFWATRIQSSLQMGTVPVELQHVCILADVWAEAHHRQIIDGPSGFMKAR